MVNEIDSLLPLILKDSKLNTRQQNLFLKVIKKIGQEPRDKRSAEEWYLLGYAAEAQNNDLKAVDHYTEAIKSNPDFEAAYKNRGAVFIRLKQFDDALFDLDKAIELDPDYLDARLQLSVLYAEQEKNDEALAAVEKILEKDPGHLRAHAQKGAIYDKTGKYEEALTEFDLVIGKIPDDANLYSQRAIAKLFSDDAEGAAEDFQKAQRLGGSNYITVFNLGLAYGLIENKSKQAYQYFEKAFRKQSNLLSTYFKEAKDGETNRLTGKLNQIIEHLRNVDDSQPGKYYRDELIDLLERKLEEAKSIE